MQLVHMAEQGRPARLQLHRAMHPALQPHRIIFNNFGGAASSSVGNGTSNSFFICHPQSVGGKLFPSHSCTCKYVRKECCFAAALVGGRVAKSNVELTDCLPIDLLYEKYLKLSKVEKFFPPYKAKINFSPVVITSVLLAETWLNTFTSSASITSDFKILKAFFLPRRYGAEVVSQPVTACKNNIFCFVGPRHSCIELMEYIVWGLLDVLGCSINSLDVVEAHATSIISKSVSVPTNTTLSSRWAVTNAVVTISLSASA